MDLVSLDQKSIAGISPDVYGKNSREQWKLANHRSLFGERDQNGGILRMNTDQLRKDKLNSKIGEGSAEDMMPMAGTKNSWDIKGTKGAATIGNEKNNRQQA